MIQNLHAPGTGEQKIGDEIVNFSFSSLGNILFKKHYKAERILLVGGVTVTLLGCGFAGGLIHAHRTMVEENNRTTNITSQVGWTKSQATYHIDRIWLNPSRTIAIVPMSFSNNAFESLSVNAKNYRIKLATADGKPIKSDPKVQLVLFGSTGKGALIMKNPVRFPSQVLTVALIEQHKLSNENNDNLPQNGGNSFFAPNSVELWAKKYGKKENISYFSVNPGASQKYHIFNRDLSKRQLNMSYIYSQVWGNDKIASIKKSQQKTQSKIQLDERKLQNYATIIKQNGYKMPDPPAFMKDDWKPANFVDPNTGAQKNQNDDAGSNLPQTVQKADGKGTLDDDVNNQKVGADSANSPIQQTQNAWNSVQQLWQDIYNDKIKIMVTDNGEIYRTKQEIKAQKDDATVSLLKNFDLRSKVQMNR